MNHTPGPWRVKHKAKLGWAGVLTQEGDIIADISVDGQDFRDPEQALNDARLIAAAPDLLRALEEAIRDHDDFEDGRLSGNTVATMYAAIAKATREKP